uniref:Uncharacterized protein n=1 Tax=Schistocephalus solidus TaxID=70667 RepID=A0A0X3P8V1_SCHSO
MVSACTGHYTFCPLLDKGWSSDVACPGGWSCGWNLTESRVTPYSTRLICLTPHVRELTHPHRRRDLFIKSTKKSRQISRRSQKSFRSDKSNNSQWSNNAEQAGKNSKMGRSKTRPETSEVTLQVNTDNLSIWDSEDGTLFKKRQPSIRSSRDVNRPNHNPTAFHQEDACKPPESKEHRGLRKFLGLMLKSIRTHLAT